MKAAIIGFMGAGKTSVSRSLAQNLSIPTVDVDDVILSRCHHESVNAVFASKGETFFRALESTVISELSQRTSLIMACGGGAVENSTNVEILKDNGFVVVFLRTSFEKICARLEGDTTRPLFRDAAAAHALYTRRQPLYEHVSDRIIDTDNLDVTGVSELVMDILCENHVGAH